MIVTEADRLFLKSSNEIIDKALEFKRQTTSFSVAVSEKDFDDSEDEGLELIMIFLNSLEKIIKADGATEKHKYEVEAIDEITRDIPDIYGEKCRDFLKHFSNLRKNFIDLTKNASSL